MTLRLLPINSRVVIDKRSEHFPGATVFIVDSCNDPEYAYCVNPSGNARDIVNAHWVKREHVRLSKAARRKPRPTMPSSASKPVVRPPVAPSPPSERPLAIGDIVEVSSMVLFGPRQGYIIDIEPGAGGCVALSANPGTDVQDISLWVRKHLVTRLEPVS